MKELKNILRKYRWWFISIFIIALLVIGLYCAGFRITYAPELETNWNAVIGVANWVSALASITIPILVLALQHKLEKDKMEISKSNTTLLEEVKNYKNHVDNSKKEEKFSYDEKAFYDEVIKYLNIAMGANTKQISKYIDLPVDKTIELLNKMYELKLIGNYYLYENKKDENCHWKVLKK